MYFLSKSGSDISLPTEPPFFLTNLEPPPSYNRKYMEKIQDKAQNASAWI